MKNIILLYSLMMILVSCDNPYKNITKDKYYKGKPFVSLSSEEDYVSMTADVNDPTHTHGVLKDSIILSNPLDHDIIVSLEVVKSETKGELNVNFKFEDTVKIDASNTYGFFNVTGLNIPKDKENEYKLSVRIKSVNDNNVIAGMYSAKKENENREKLYKKYSFR